MRKGYKPKSSREKFPLTITEQQTLVERAEGKEKALLLLMLSTGVHPKVLAQKQYGFTWNDSYYSFKRPKTRREVKGAWSKAMKEEGILESLVKFKHKTAARYWQVLKALGREAKITELCPLQLRHTYFVNRARLGHNAFDIAHGAGTDLRTVYNYYTIGMGESKSLTPDESAWLRWLMEV